ncbi:MAG: glycerophosphodiester phosphodiesterase family protein [Anaerosacchariphilus sp.]
MRKQKIIIISIISIVIATLFIGKWKCLKNEKIGEKWIAKNNEWYYLDESGKLVSESWVAWHYLLKDGRMARDQWIERKYIDNDGVYNGRYFPESWEVPGSWEKKNGTWYYIWNKDKQKIDFTNMRSINRLGYKTNDMNTPPEQSEAGYRMAYEKGFRILLCDLRYTADDVPVCIHDETINRVARKLDGKELINEVYVEESEYAELLSYDWGLYKSKEYVGTKVLRIDEMCALCKELGVELYIEVKAGNEKQIEKTVELVNTYNVKVSWACSTDEECKIIVNTDKHARVATMPRNLTDKEIKFLESLQTGQNEVFVFGWENTTLTPEIVKKLQNRNINFEMGTIDTYEEMIYYWNEAYRYCSGIESNCVVASNIDMDVEMSKIIQN